MSRHPDPRIEAACRAHTRAQARVETGDHLGPRLYFAGIALLLSAALSLVFVGQV